jgi:hypothetical protein|tara:strand:- start:407 stop:793 length:387 start_codon:yes stop_codon:yes gene_type:complete
MNSALLKRLGIKEGQVIQPTKAIRGKKETTDSAFVKDVRQKMNIAYISHTSLISATYLDANFARDEKGNLQLDKNRKKVVDNYTPKNLNGQYILEDNGDGTHTATKLNVYKETYIVDSESVKETKVTS